MLKLFLIFCVTISQAKANDEAKVADLVRDHHICAEELNVCEKSLDKALTKNVSTSFFQDPMVITGSILTSLVVGFVAGQASK